MNAVKIRNAGTEAARAARAARAAQAEVQVAAQAVRVNNKQIYRYFEIYDTHKN